MPVFEYKAKSKFGDEIIGTYEAEDKAAVIFMLRENDYVPVNIKEERGSAFLGLIRIFKRVNQKDLAIFCRQFATMVNAGISILAALDILRKQADNPKLREVLESVYLEVQKGKNLSMVMSKYPSIFPPLFLNMVEAGEVSGTLDKVMERMAAHYEKEYKLNEKIKNALIYPALIAIVAVIVVAILVTVVLPTFADMFHSMGATLPAQTRFLMSLSNIIKENFIALIFLIVGLAIFIRIYLKSEQGIELIDNLKLKLPILGNLNKKVATARFARTLGALLNSGISLLESLEVTKKVIGNTVLQKAFVEIEGDLKKGRGLSEPLSKIQAFPPMLVHMVKIGEDTGSLDVILDKTADFYDEEVENAITKMTTLLEPAIILAMAGVVGFIVISIIIPMFDIMTNVNF